jgi:hypothetical protein
MTRNDASDYDNATGWDYSKDDPTTSPVVSISDETIEKVFEENGDEGRLAYWKTHPERRTQIREKLAVELRKYFSQIHEEEWMGFVSDSLEAIDDPIIEL